MESLRNDNDTPMNDLTNAEIEALQALVDAEISARKEAKELAPNNAMHWLWRGVEVAENARNVKAGHALGRLLAALRAAAHATPATPATGAAGEAVAALVTKWGVEGIDQSSFGSEDAADAYLACSAQLKAVLNRAALTTPAAAEAGAAGSSGTWVDCDGIADYQAEEELVWVTMPDGRVKQAMFKEAYWEDESKWTDNGRHKEPPFLWAECTDEGPTWETLIPQPTHFQPKPLPAAPTATPDAPAAGCGKSCGRSGGCQGAGVTGEAV